MDQEIVLTSPETFEGKLKLTWCIEGAQKDATIKFKIMKLALKGGCCTKTRGRCTFLVQQPR